jgi:hypothetical protein
MLLDDLLKILREVVLRASDNTKIGSRLFWKTDRYLKLFEFFMVSGVLHLS